MDIHTDHRKRLKDRFRKEGLDNFDERHVLELLLFYCIPRKDTKELAVELLNHFGSIVQVFDATPEELEKISGAGEGVATFLALRRSVDRYYQIKRAEQDCSAPLKTALDFEQYLRCRFEHQRNEVVYLLCLDAKCKLISCIFAGEGGVNSANVPIRRVVEICLNANATSVVIAHNHPTGIAIPSPEDTDTTYRLAQALRGVDIYLADHMIFSEGDSISMAVSGYYKPSW